MADFLDSEAEEDSEEEPMDDGSDVVRQVRTAKKIILDSDEEDEDDGEEVNDLIDDNPIDDEEDSDNDSRKSRKRKKSDDEDDEDFDDRLEDEDYELLEENLGVKVQKKRRRIIQDADSDDEGTQDGDDREAGASQIFDGSDNEDAPPGRGDRAGSVETEDSDDNDGFIVDDEDRPLKDKRKKKKPIFADSSLQEAQDIFGVEFDYDDFEKYEDQYYEDGEEEEEDEYEDEDEQKTAKVKKVSKKRRNPKYIYEIYEPSELERAGYTDEDSRIRSSDVPERMQIRGVPVLPGTDEELDEEAEWIFERIFKNRRPVPDVSMRLFESDVTAIPNNPMSPQSAWNMYGDDIHNPYPPPGSPGGNDTVVNVAASGEDEDDWDNPGGSTAPKETLPKNPVSRQPPPVSVNVSGDDDEDWDNPNPVSSTVAEPLAETLMPPPAAPTIVIPPGDEENWDDDVNTTVTSTVPELPVNFRRTVPNTEAVKTQYIPKIRKALEFMRNQYLEVPFIAFYRKEYTCPELNINDLWAIYSEDAKFCQLRDRKAKLTSLWENMQSYQSYLILSKPDEPIPDSMRLIKDDDLEHLKTVQSHEELKDAYMQFTLYYSEDLALMREYHSKKRKEAAIARLAEIDPENPPQDLPPEEPLDDDEPDIQSSVKRKSTSGTYGLCRKMKLDTFAKKFGLPPDKFAQNLRDNYQRFEVEQYPIDPNEASREYICERLLSPDDVLKAARYMVAMQISREPLVRRSLREAFYERAGITSAPTKKGLKEIDESHTLFNAKFLRLKPLKDFKDDLFLKLVTAEEDGLITMKIGENIKGITQNSFVEEIKQLYYKDEFTNNVKQWNEIRGEVIEEALHTHIFPALRKEIRAKLLQDAKEYVIAYSAARLRQWLSMKAFEPDLNDLPEDDRDQWLPTKGIRVISLAYVPDYSQAGFACFLGSDGDPSDYIRLANITKSFKSWKESDRIEKEADMLAFKNFIRMKKPHLIVIGGESRDAVMIQEDLGKVVNELEREDNFPNVNVEIFDNQLSKVFANSIKGMNDFRDYPELLRQAISLGRRAQDALIEFSQLCTSDDEIICLKFHPLQDLVNKDDLLERLHMEFINRTNEVGVDVNRALAHPHTSNLLQYVSGLGRRKATHLLKVLKQNNHRLENRTQLITLCHMGPKIFINCSSFIKIDTLSLGDSTEAYVEVLDNFRVHPETYEWARKMAVDALDLDDEDTNPATALEEILQCPERLKDLDLDAFARELVRQGFGNKRTTLYDIREDLMRRPYYNDLRDPYVSPTSDELFAMLTRETPDTLYVGRLLVATVVGFVHKKPQGEQLDNATPNKNNDTGMWICSFCYKGDFADLSEVWNHFDTNACPGQAMGIRLRLDNGISGFLPIHRLSDREQVTNPEDRVRRGQSIHCRITKIEADRFSVELTSRTSDLMNVNGEFRRPKDRHFDYDAEDTQSKRDAELKNQQKQRPTYVKRVIIHPSFKNISYREAEKLMGDMDQGEAIIRPSSKGDDHLTATWKITDGIYQHIDVREKQKENAFSLGKSLYIAEEEFEDLDEIIARHINPMASYARDILNYRYFKPFDSKQVVDEYLLKEKERSANKIHYIFYPSREFPGKFLLAYLPKDKVRHEFVGVRAEGFRFRQQNFDSLGQLLKWFKEHYRDPPPQATPVLPPQALRTPFATPGNNEAAARIPGPTPSAFSTAIANQGITPGNFTTTPAGAYTPFTSHTPYTPTAQTPYMTPFQQPGHFPVTPAPPQTTVGFVHNTAAGAGRGQQRLPGPARSIANTTIGGENLDWRRAAEAWARSQQKSHVPGYSRSEHGGEGNRTPATRNAAQVISEGIERTRQMSNAAQHFVPQTNKSPRTGRDSLKSTPRTNFSPRSMIESSLGDETPLFDEH